MDSTLVTTKRRLGWTVAVLASAQLIIALDATIVYVALPGIAELGFSAQTLQWVVSAYAVAFGGCLMLGGRAADLLGRRRMFAVALLLYAGSSLAGGLAGSPGLIVAARAVQGVGGALLFPATLSLVNVTFAEGRERNRALAVWGGAGASGLCIGSLLGGVLTDAFGWRAVFFVNVPLAGLLALLGMLLIPLDHASARGRRFDLPGAAVATAGVTLGVVALAQGPAVGWSAPSIVTSAVLAVLLLVAFVVIEARGRDPLMPLRLLANRSLRAAMAVTFLFMGTYGALFYVLTIYFQRVRGFDPLETGLAFLVPSLVIAAGTQVGERLATRTTARTTLLVGMLTGAAGTALLASELTTSASFAEVLPGIAVSAFGQGISWTGMWVAAATGVAQREQGVASGMASTTMQVGAAVGLAVLVAISESSGLRTATYAAAIGILAGAAVALTLRTRTRGMT